MIRRSVAAAAFVALAVSPLSLVHTASAAPAAPTVPSQSASLAASKASGNSLKASTSQVLPGERFKLTAVHSKKALKKLSSKKKRQVRMVVERRAGSRWVRLSSAKPKNRKITVTTSSTALGVVGYRSYVKSGKQKLAKAATSVTVVAQTVSADIQVTEAADAGTFEAQVLPFRAGRTLSLEELQSDGSWKVVGAPVRADASGRATLSRPGSGIPAWYRVSASAYNGAAAVRTTPVRTSLARVPGLVAHRAGAGVAPEQTLAAVDAVIDSGAAALEIDVQLSSDGEPVIVHDPDFKRTTDVETVFPARQDDPVGSFTLAEIKQLDAGSWFDPAFAGEEIPTLDEVLTAINGEAHLVLEVKDPGLLGNADIDQRLDEELATGQLGVLAAAGKLTVSSFDLVWLETFAGTAEADDVTIAVLTGNPSEAQVIGWKVWADEVQAFILSISKERIAFIRAQGMAATVWTVNSVALMRVALGLGVDHIITDFTARLDEALNPPLTA